MKIEKAMKLMKSLDPKFATEILAISGVCFGAALALAFLSQRNIPMSIAFYSFGFSIPLLVTGSGLIELFCKHEVDFWVAEWAIGLSLGLGLNAAMVGVAAIFFSYSLGAGIVFLASSFFGLALYVYVKRSKRDEGIK